VEADASAGAQQARTATPLTMAATTREVLGMLITLVPSVFSRLGPALQSCQMPRGPVHTLKSVRFVTSAQLGHASLA
jgi:hypothetical protein